jgi:hypothetical protein
MLEDNKLSDAAIRELCRALNFLNSLSAVKWPFDNFRCNLEYRRTTNYDHGSAPPFFCGATKRPRKMALRVIEWVKFAKKCCSYEFHPLRDCVAMRKIP